MEGIPWETVAPHEIEEVTQKTMDAVAAATEALDAASKGLMQKVKNISDGEESETILRSEIRPLFQKLATGRRSIATVHELVQTAKERAARQTALCKRKES